MGMFAGNMGNDAIFGPIKASVQAVCGKGDEAKDTMKRFKEGNPAVLGVRACYHMAKGGEGERDKGKALGKQGLKNTATIVEGVVNGIPVIGHAKGAYHYRRGNKDRGDSAMKSASRSTAGENPVHRRFLFLVPPRLPAPSSDIV